MASHFGDQARKDFKGATQKAGETMEKAGEAAQTATEDAKGFISTATQRTKDAAKDAASYVGDKAEHATEAVGAGIENLGDKVRRISPKDGMLHNAGEAVADTLESSGRYLEEHGLSGIGEDVTSMVRRNPIPALLIAVGIGFMLARITRS
jgi:ElaB/YqjD/DUF883 family membrane-anchored ribosome-binding protein